MIWEKIRGHAAQVEMFRRCVRRGRLAHAYLFVGPEGIGKKLFARALAQSLFCERFDDSELEACGECSSCRQMMAGTHPDFLSVSRPDGKRELPIDLIAGSREKRGREGLCYELSLRPTSSARKIALIDDAHRMNQESANAFLKTLEEPAPYALLLLISPSADAVGSTIRSRCQLVRFNPLSSEDEAGLILELDLTSDRDEANRLSGLCDGSLSTAEQMLDPALRELREKLYDALANEQFGGRALVGRMLEGLDGIGGDSQTQRRAAGWLIRFVIEFFSQCLRDLSGAGTPDGTDRQVARFTQKRHPASDAELELMIEMIERAASAERQVERMAPIPLCLEGLFDDMSRLMRVENTSRSPSTRS